MANISVVDAAFTGLRVVRRNPGAVIAWAILHLISVALFTWLALSRFHDVFAKIHAMPIMQGHPDPATAQARLHAMAPIFHEILPLYAIMFPIALVLASIFICAMNRAVLRPREDGLGYLRLGLDEFRQFALLIALFVVQLIAGVLVGGLAYAALYLTRTVTHGAGALPMIVGVTVFCLGMILFKVKMSLASAQSFATRQINVFGTWGLTNGQFLPMVATYILAFILSLVVGLILLFVLAVVGMVTAGMGGMSHMDAAHMASFHLGAFHLPGPHTLTVTAGMPPNLFLPNGMPDMHALALFLTPAVVIQLVVHALVFAILLPFALTPPAAIYKALTADPNRGAGGVLNMS